MGILGRLGQWQAIQRVRPSEELPDVVGGRDGELLLRELVGASYQFKGALLLSGRRIPSKRQGRRREIDLIVCTPRMIHLIEVKNWSGRLAVEAGVWRQTRRGGDVVEHRDLLETNELKRDAVVEYLHDRGIPLAEPFIREHIVPRIVFMNPRLELDPAIEKRSDVISRRELDGYLAGRRAANWAEQLFSAFVDLCLDTASEPGGKRDPSAPAPIPGPLYRRIVACLSEVGTWDQLHFYGTRRVAGDVVGLKIGPKTYRRPELAEMSGPRPIQLAWSRGWVMGLLKSITGLGSLGNLYLGKRRLAINTDHSVLFHAVGDQSPNPVRLVDLDRIVLG